MFTTLLQIEVDQPSTIALLKAHEQFVTHHLWEKLIASAADSYYLTSPDRSLLSYRTALAVAKQLNDKSLLAITYYDTGRTHSGLGQISKAIQAYLESQQAFAEAGRNRDIIYILSDLGSLYLASEDYQKAKAYSEQSIALANRLKNSKEVAGAWPDEFGVAGALTTLGYLDLRQGDYTQALDYLKKSLALFNNLDNGHYTTYSVYIADNVADLSHVYYVIGNNIQALSYLNKALAIAQTLPYKNRVAGILNSMGILYLDQGNYSLATRYFNDSLQTFLAQGDNQYQAEVARLLLNIGVCKLKERQYSQARESFQESLKKAEAIHYKEVLIAAREGIGSVYQEQGSYALALEWLDKSWSVAKEAGDQTRMAELLWRKAEVHCATGNYSEAITLAESAVKIARQLQLPNLSFLATTTLGRAYLGQEKPDLAFQALSQAIEQIESMRAQVAGLEEEQQLFFENKVASYHLMIELLLAQHKVAEAFLYAERAKGRVLLDVLGSGRTHSAEAITPQDEKKGQELNRIIIELNKRIRAENLSKNPDAKLLENLEAHLNSARLEYESFQNTLYAAHPDLKLQRGRTPILTLDALSALVENSKTAFLEYVVAKEKIYLFVLTKKDQTNNLDLRIYPINIKAEDLTEKVNRFHQLMADRNPLFSEPSRELYDLLVKPAEQQLQGRTILCIVPDGALWDVPFQALQPTDNRYLIEDYALYYAPSLNVLKEMKRSKGVNPKPIQQSFIAFGNPTASRETVATLQEVNRGESFEPLPEAEAEITKVKQIIGSSQSKVFIGANADERSFKSLAPTFNIIHLATHGVLDNQHPLYSYLLLSRAEEDTDNDGLLEAREIMNMNLHADLAVLSACETARGRVGAGEGVIGMSWAFFVAGVRTTLVSQWKVNSKSTSELMVSFYTHLKSDASHAGDTKANALRLAALEIMKNPRYRHPFYWAGFVMIGSNK